MNPNKNANIIINSQLSLKIFVTISMFEIKLNTEEKDMFEKSVEAVRQLNSIAAKME